MACDSMFREDEARCLLGVMRKYFLCRCGGDIPADERAAIGRLLDEIQSASSTPANLPDPKPSGVRLIR